MILLFSFFIYCFRHIFQPQGRVLAFVILFKQRMGTAISKSIDNIRKSLFLDGRFDRTELEFLS